MSTEIYRPAWRHKRPAPRKSPGIPPPMADNITWTRDLKLESPAIRQRYRIEYIDRDNDITVREIELQRIGTFRGETYLGVIHQGKFKSLRADRLRMVAQLSTGHSAAIRSQPTYTSELPAWTADEGLYRIPTTAVSNRSWRVDLRAYTCTCPEKRIRSAMGYAPGQLGFVCAHMAKAITGNLPAELQQESGWTPELIAFLENPRKIHIDNLTAA